MEKRKRDTLGVPKKEKRRLKEAATDPIPATVITESPGPDPIKPPELFEVLGSVPPGVFETGKYIRVFHAVNAGDLIASLAGIREYCRMFDRKAVIYQQINKPGNYYPGATHPLQDDEGRLVTMTKTMFDMLRPLVLAQPYIHDIIVYDGQPFDINLDRVHNELFVNMPNGSINRWIFYAFPGMACDLSEQWLSAENTFPLYKLIHKDHENHVRSMHGKIILNFSERYRNNKISYFFLRKYQKDIVFSGTEREHELFSEQWKLDIPRLNVPDFNVLAQAMKQCRLFLGNQSMCWNIAEALKIPRIVEACSWAANCIPIGKHAYDFYYQGSVEWYVETLFNRGANPNCPVCGTSGKYDVPCETCGTVNRKQETEPQFPDRGNPEMFITVVAGMHGIETVLDFQCRHGILVDKLCQQGYQAWGYNPNHDLYKDFPVGTFDLVLLIDVIQFDFNQLDYAIPFVRLGGVLFIWYDYFSGSTRIPHSAIIGYLGDRGFDLTHHADERYTFQRKRIINTKPQ